MEIIMIQEKVTPGTIRYGDGDNHNIYLKKEEVAKLGNPDALKVTIEPNK